MERESFMDEDVARLINDHFVAIIIDREERPDLDSYFMDICTSLTGTGGWPMTIVMSPSMDPIFAGTYFPKSSRGGLMGLVDLLPALVKAWRDRAPPLTGVGGSFGQGNDSAAVGPFIASDIDLLRGAFADLRSSYDREFGGFGPGPKFPTAHRLGFLLRYWKRFNSQEALQMVENTLRAMREGGIYDQLGGGFHRYAVDREWLLPHFEKMMCDQALLGYLYAEAYQATGNKFYADVVNGIFTFVSNEMRAPGGAFLTAIDADSEGEEGRFYLWSRPELERALPPKLLDCAIAAFGIEEGAIREGRAAGTLHMVDSVEAIARRLNLTPKAFNAELSDIISRLLTSRNGRVRPRADTKVLCDISGMAIAFLSRAYSATGDARYARAAKECAGFVLSKLTMEDGALYHAYADNTATVNGLLDDYAYMCWGLRELYEAVFETEYMEQAIGLLDFSIKHFLDCEGGGFYNMPDFSAETDRGFRRKELYDGAIPSGNSIHALNLLYFSRMTGRESYQKASDLTFSWAKSIAARDPASYTGFLQSVDAELGPLYTVALTGKKGDVIHMAAAVREAFVPNKMLIYRPLGCKLWFAPFTDAIKGEGNKPMARVCTDKLCKLPTGDVVELLQQLTY